MKRIGIDIRALMSPVRSGVGEYTFELLNSIFKTDKANQYFLFYNSYKDISSNIPKWSQDNVHYIHTKWPNKLYNASIKLFGIPKINKVKLDYFFSPNFNFTSLPTNTKSILTVHDLSFEFFPEFFSIKQRLWHWAINPKKQCEKTDIIITPSENTKRDIIDIYKINPEKIKVIYPGISCLPENISTETKDRIKQRYNLPHRFILFLGTIEPRKNILGLIEAFEQFCKTSTIYSLVIAGHNGWNDKEIYQKFKSSPIKDKIKFIGSVDSNEKSALYTMSELFVYPSFYEGFGFPVAEAFACGAPVITSNRSSLPEVTENSAYLVNPNRPLELARALIEMTKNEKLREKFKNLGLEQAKKFNWDKAAKEFMGLFRQT